LGWFVTHLLKLSEGVDTNTKIGFYVLDHSVKDQLILGPFQGKVACQVIKFGRGVCGAAAQRKETVLVDDVENFPGHIACE
jgi:L-methionine (R)-S-oxide reductase